MEEEPPTPPTPAQPTSPFWLPSTSTRRHRFRPNSALVLNTGFFVVLLSISAIAFLAILTPSLLSSIQHVLRPSSIKRGWDSLNLFLVVFAVVCGFLGRKDVAVDDEQSSKDETPRLVRSEQSDWYPYGYQGNVVQLRRSFKSYPDLRQEILWENDRIPRYFDDTWVGNYNSPRLTRSAESFRSQKVGADLQNGSVVKNIEVSDLRLHKSEDSTPPPVESIPPSSSTAPPASLEPPVPDLSIGAEDSKKEYQSIRRRGRRTRRSAAKEADSPPPARRTRSPPQPPPVPEVGQRDSEEESAKSTPKKRGGMTKEIISSIYHQSKRKKNQKRRSHENLEEFISPPNPNPSFPPPPPPPPPPPSIFHGLFSSKKGKVGRKSSSTPTPPPPPPRRRSSASHAVVNSTKAKTRFTPPPAATSRTNLNLIDQFGGDGSESPLIPIPPPPPPPPFKFRSWKFAVEGDYVKITGSPKSGGDSEMDESDASTPMADGKAHPSFSCPSPDVNHKADDFIAMFRAKLELEKMNSIKQKQESGIGFSPLGPDYSPSPSPT